MVTDFLHGEDFTEDLTEPFIQLYNWGFETQRSKVWGLVV